MSTIKRVFICQSPIEIYPSTFYWDQYKNFQTCSKSDLLLLNEMPFDHWHFEHKDASEARVLQSPSKHIEAIKLLSDTCPFAALIASAPRQLNHNTLINQSFLWQQNTNFTLQWGHSKQYFPEEAGFYESTWFKPGSTRYELFSLGKLKIGVLLCTDAMFIQWGRFYAKKGAHIIAAPRSTTPDVDQRWETLLRALAFTSGCYVFSSNRYGASSENLFFGGESFAFDPKGKPLGRTSVDNPILYFDIDLSLSESAKTEYPLYVKDITT